MSVVGALRRVEQEIVPPRISSATIILLGVSLVALWYLIQLRPSRRSRSRAG